MVGVLVTLFATFPSRAEGPTQPPVSQAKLSLVAEEADAIPCTEMTEPRNIVSCYARQYGVNEALARRISWCESGFKPWAKNPVGTASGLYQFIASSWERVSTQLGYGWTAEDVFDKYKNAEAGAYWLSIVGTSPWKASEGCWKNQY